MRFLRHRISILLAGFSIAVGVSNVQTAPRQTVPPTAPQQLFDKYCIACHNQRLQTGALTLDRKLDTEGIEKVIARLRAGSMPPPGNARPDTATYHAVAGALEREIDRAWDASPNPGRIAAVHRLNRAEYNN